MNLFRPRVESRFILPVLSYVEGPVFLVDLPAVPLAGLTPLRMMRFTVKSQG
jgi:hypothetical protein